MADRIKKFFKNLKGDATFKMAGPGHKLSESTISSNSSRSVKEMPVVKRSELSDASKVAAEAALARLQQKANNPTFNTSFGAIQAKVKRELENEKASVSKSTAEPQITDKKDPEEVPKNYATSGVYFKCPLISNAVLTKEEWKENIKSFLYEQLEYERGLTACLIIQSCNSNREKVKACVETLCKYLENIITHPEEEKYQKIRMSNRMFSERVQPVEGSMELLLAAGFEQRQLPSPAGGDEDYLVFDQHKLSTVDNLTMLIDALRSAEPIQLELDRNLEVLLPAQASAKNELPDSFYSLTKEELRKQQLLRQEAIEKSQMLQTKAMREKEELRAMKKYKYALIRIRFPDGILLQGTFSVYERYRDIHEFVRENLQHDLPFSLNTPTGHRLAVDEDSDKTLIDLGLVPATVLNFVWQQLEQESIDNKVYLKSDIMMLLQEM